MAPKKKKAGPPPVFATSSVKSRKNVEEEIKLVEQKKQAEEEAKAAAEAAKKLAEDEEARKKTELAATENGNGAPGGRNKAKGGQAQAGGKDPREEELSPLEELIATKEKEELSKLGLRAKKGAHTWDYLKPAGTVAVSPELEEQLFSLIAGGMRNCGLLKGSSSNSLATTTAPAPLPPTSSTETNRSIDGAAAATSLDDDAPTPAPADNCSANFPVPSTPDADPVSSALYFPDAYRVKSKSGLSYDKLNAVYLDLQELGFEDEDIERAMRATRGYDGRAALEHLVLTSSSSGTGAPPSERLPLLFRSPAEQAVAEDVEIRRKREEAAAREQAEEKGREIAAAREQEAASELEAEKRRRKQDSEEADNRDEENAAEAAELRASADPWVDEMLRMVLFPELRDTTGGEMNRKKTGKAGEKFSYDDLGADTSPTSETTLTAGNSLDPLAKLRLVIYTNLSLPEQQLIFTNLKKCNTGEAQALFVILWLEQIRARAKRLKKLTNTARQKEASAQLVALQRIFDEHYRAFDVAEERLEAERGKLPEAPVEEEEEGDEDESTDGEVELDDDIVFSGGSGDEGAADDEEEEGGSDEEMGAALLGDEDVVDLFDGDGGRIADVDVETPGNAGQEIAGQEMVKPAESSVGATAPAPSTSSKPAPNHAKSAVTTKPASKFNIVNSGANADTTRICFQGKRKRRRNRGGPKTRIDKLPLKDSLNISPSWPGLYPSKFLDQYVQRHIARYAIARKSYSKDFIGKVTIVAQPNSDTPVHTFSPPYRTKNKKAAVELASTYALFKLQQLARENEDVEEQLPPAFRSCFIQWERELAERKLEMIKQRVKPRVRFCLEICNDVRLEELRKEKRLANFSGGRDVVSEVRGTGRKGDGENCVGKTEGNNVVVDGAAAPRIETTPTPSDSDNMDPEEDKEATGAPDAANAAPRVKEAWESDSDEDDLPSRGNGGANSSVKSKRNFSVDELARLKKRAKIDYELVDWYTNTNKSRRENTKEQRENLPIQSYRDEILDVVEDGRVSIVLGSTGSGKTTQVPQYVLEEALVGTAIGNKPAPIVSMASCAAAAAMMGGDEKNVCEKNLPFLPTIIVTEPRRLSAMSVAQRVAAEMGEKCGSGLVGYQIRLEKVAHPLYCRLMFCTTGVLLQRMKSDPYLEGVTHVFVDEVHERSADSDLALLLLKRNLGGSSLKLCLMSATADERKLTKYFEDIESVINCLPRSVSVPGRIFPVDEFFLEDVIEKTGWFITASTQDAAFYSKEFSKNNYFDDGDEDEQRLNDIDLPYDVDDYSGATLSTLKTIDHSRINFELIQRLLEWIEEQSHNGSGLFDIRGGEANDDSDDDDGPRAAGRRRDRSGEAILIFLPGMPQISRLYNQLSQHEFFGDSSRALLVPLHSMIASKDQQKAFDAPPRGVRKIVLSTNIAETGVTIPDVVFVIDSGKVKQQKYHEPTNTSSLKEVFVSRAEAIQRKGRAGRVRPGFCFRLYTKKRFDKRFLESAIPELLRCSLTELTLNVLIGGFQPSLFQEALDPPLLSRVQHAVSLLRDVGCCNEEEGEGVAGSSSSYRITPLGRALALLPVDLRVGKMLLLSQLFGGSDFVLSAAAALSNAKSPFLEPFDEGGRESAKAKQRLYFTRLVTKSGGCVFSDHLAAAEALRDFEGCKGQGEQFNLCRVNQLSSQAMAQIKDIKDDLKQHLDDEFPNASLRNPKDRPSLAGCLVAAGLRPNLARSDPNPHIRVGDKYPQILVSSGSDVSMKVANNSFVRTHELPPTARWLAYYHKTSAAGGGGHPSSQLRDVTVLSNPLWFLLFQTSDWDLVPEQRCVVFNGHKHNPVSSASGASVWRDWQCCSCSPRLAIALRQVKLKFEAVFRAWILGSVERRGSSAAGTGPPRGGVGGGDKGGGRGGNSRNKGGVEQKGSGSAAAGEVLVEQSGSGGAVTGSGVVRVGEDGSVLYPNGELPAEAVAVITLMRKLVESIWFLQEGRGG